MIVESVRGAVIASNGVTATDSFSIAGSPHMFNVLSNLLYSDSISASLREVGCNAVDAHIAVGKADMPIEVKLPTKLDRTFHIKDWGPGLSDEEVRGLYATYGASTKQQSADMTGAFGLGSKSPFAYTTQNPEAGDGFTVTTAKGGTQRIYTCYLNDEGVPVVSLLHSAPASPDWPTGVMVSYAVHEKDIKEFHTKAAKVLRWFKVCPNVIGFNGSETLLAPPVFGVNHPGFALNPHESEYMQPAVVMGGVRYPVRAERMNDIDPLSQLLLSSGIHLFLPIGAVMMTPSREELHYTEKTKATLLASLRAAANELATSLYRDLLPVPGELPWAEFQRTARIAERLTASLRTEIHLLLELVKDAPAAELGDMARRIRTPLAELPLDCFSQPTGNRTGYRVRVMRPDGARIRGVEIHSPLTVLRKTERAAASFTGKQDVKIILEDVSRARTRVRTYLYDGNADVAIVLTPEHIGHPKAAAQAADKLAMESSLAGLPLIKASSLPAPAGTCRKAPPRVKGVRMSRAERLAQETVLLFTKSGVKPVLLGSVPEDCRYWMVSTNSSPSKFNGGRLYNELTPATAHADEDDDEPETLWMEMRRSMWTDIFGPIETLAAHGVKNINGCVLVSRPGTARRLLLAESGFKPFLPALGQAVKQAESEIEALYMARRSTPYLALNGAFNVRDYGIAGALALVGKKAPAMWERIQQTLGHTALYREAHALLTQHAKGGADPVSPTLSALDSALSKLRTISYFPELPNCCLTESFSVIRERAWEGAPALQFIDVDRVANGLVHADSSTAQQVLAMLAAATTKTGSPDSKLRLVA